MTVTFQQLIKDTNKVDLNDICSCWQWRLTDQKSVALILSIGDMFLIGKDDTINCLDTSTGELKKIANEKTLKENEVYNFTIPPALLFRLKIGMTALP